MSGLFDSFVALVMEGVSAVLNLVIENRKEKRDLQKLIVRQREEHAIAAQHWAERGRQRSLKGFDLTGAELENVDLANADLTEASFRDAKLTNLDLREANLTGADFSGASLTMVNFSRANLSRTDFTDTNLQDVDFCRANLRGAQFLQVDEITECTWENIYINSETRLTQELKTKIVNSF